MSATPRDRSWGVAVVLAVCAGLLPLALLACSPTSAHAAVSHGFSGISVDSLGATSTIEATITVPDVQAVEITGTPGFSLVGTPAVSVVGSMSPVSVDVRAWGLEPEDVQWAFMLTVYFGGVCLGRFLY